MGLEKYLGKTVEIEIDRSLGSKHPKHGFIYEVNYGYVPETKAADGEEIDAYLLGVDKPVGKYLGKCIAIIHRSSDDDDKLIIASPNAENLSNEEINKLIRFQEKYFHHKIISMEKINKTLIASCGMNCGLCLHYLRKNNKCPGCYSGRKVNQKPIKCYIRLCKKRQGEYCFLCTEFPCERLKRLDKRYREKYDMSEIENLEFIRDNGIEKFIKNQCQKYQSEKGTFCVHDKKYYK